MSDRLVYSTVAQRGLRPTITNYAQDWEHGHSHHGHGQRTTAERPIKRGLSGNKSPKTKRSNERAQRERQGEPFAVGAHRMPAGIQEVASYDSSSGRDSSTLQEREQPPPQRGHDLEAPPILLRSPHSHEEEAAAHVHVQEDAPEMIEASLVGDIQLAEVVTVTPEPVPQGLEDQPNNTWNNKGRPTTMTLCKISPETKLCLGVLVLLAVVLTAIVVPTIFTNGGDGTINASSTAWMADPVPTSTLAPSSAPSDLSPTANPGATSSTTTFSPTTLQTITTSSNVPTTLPASPNDPADAPSSSSSRPTTTTGLSTEPPTVAPSPLPSFLQPVAVVTPALVASSVQAFGQTFDVLGTTEITLSGKSLTGTLPSQLGFLTALTRLRLNDNQLSGSIPSELGQLILLEEFLVDHNALTGTLPSSLCQLTLVASLSSCRVDANEVVVPTSSCHCRQI